MTTLALPLTLEGVASFSQDEKVAQAQRWMELGFPMPSREEVMGADNYGEVTWCIRFWLGMVDSILDARPQEKRRVRINRDADGRIESIESNR